MMRAKLETTDGVVEVVIAAKRADARAAIEYRGEPAAVARVKQILPLAFGMFGHAIGEVTTPLDLAAALASPSLASFRPMIVEGLELLGAPREA